MTDTTPAPRMCFYIVEGQFHPTNGYIPSLVTEDEPGHSPMAGRGELSEPWYWGTDLETARRVCAMVNLEDFGLTEEDAADIVASSIGASIRTDAHRQRVSEDLDRKLGRLPSESRRLAFEDFQRKMGRP